LEQNDQFLDLAITKKYPSSTGTNIGILACNFKHKTSLKAFKNYQNL